MKNNVHINKRDENEYAQDFHQTKGEQKDFTLYIKLPKADQRVLKLYTMLKIFWSQIYT